MTGQPCICEYLLTTMSCDSDPEETLLYSKVMIAIILVRLGNGVIYRPLAWHGLVAI